MDFSLKVIFENWSTKRVLFYIFLGDDIFPEIASHLAQLEANPEPIEREVKI